MANIYRRGDTWYGRATYKGEEHRKSLATGSKAVAQERLQEWVERLKASNWGDKPRRTFEETVRKFMQEHLPRLKETSRRRYTHSLLHLEGAMRGKFLDQITSAVLSEFEEKRRKDGVVNGSIRRDLSCLSSVFRCAEEWEYFTGNPAASYLRARARRGLKEAPPRTRYLSQEEEDKILGHIQGKLAEAKGNRDKHGWQMIEAAVAFGIDTGLRKEEQLALTWRDIDIDREQVNVPDARAKSGRGRQVPLLPRTLALLETLPRHKESTYVFWHRKGQRYTHLYQQLVRITDKLGIEDVRWHDLRRTCGCRLIQDHKLSMERVALWLGHSSVVVTEKIYAFLDVRHLHEAVRVNAQNLAHENARLLDKQQISEEYQAELELEEND
jgi:integrase